MASRWIRPVTFALVLGGLAAGSLSCAASLCERKHSYMSTQCSGGDVAYQPDAMCEAKVKNCNAAQMAAFEGYVSCLESQNICSLDAIAQCAEQHPGGVNLACS
ncbi:MAG: hypothetical protein RMA76_38750 [Deltaproteobacteria bacterium]|jgi:hypothetical protein